MADQIRHNHSETAQLAAQMGAHADHLQSTAGEHTRSVNRRLQKNHHKDALATAAKEAATEIMSVIKTAERELRQHLRMVQTGLNHMSNNHHKNDKVLADKIANIHKRSEDQVKKLRSETHRAQGPDPSKPPATVTLQWKPGMSRPGFARKAQQLAGMSREGKLFKATNKVLRDTNITGQYKSALIHIIYENQRGNPKLQQAAIAVAASMNPDHVQDLQLGGLDHWENIKMLHGKTNTVTGQHQVWPAIMNVPDGTPVKVKVKWK
ncbi:hypothetical protein AB0D56_38245 [Streptomyces sp. NPDC048209]|uniref:hypothetical protein n=1 Tax=Streptomyces sp. NPDC048209 TaxID=3156689 RepID=UPI003437E132